MMRVDSGKGRLRVMITPAETSPRGGIDAAVTRLAEAGTRSSGSTWFGSALSRVGGVVSLTKIKLMND